MEVKVRVPSQLRQLVGGAATVVVDAGAAEPPTVAAVLDALAVDHPALERRVRDELGRTRVHVNVFVDADNVRDLDGLTTSIRPGQELSVIPAISGGAR
jgi:molybdopterin converting factor small subunit